MTSPGELPEVLPAERAAYRDFANHHLQGFGSPLPETLWHYTDAKGLIGILESGVIYFTQISCLNDSLEQAYAGNVILSHVRAKLATNTDQQLEPFLKIAEAALSNRDFSSHGRFVACFSEIEDDLGQWRGYGGGECGYAIGFRSHDLYHAVTGNRPDVLFVPMNYDAVRHNALATDVLIWAETFYRQGIARGITNLQAWSLAVLQAFAQELDIFASVLKHPSFKNEQERRIVAPFNASDVPNLIFRQKRTLLARILPIDISIPGPPRRLPIANVWVGPGPAQQVSRISVGDLLLKHGYSGVRVETSRVPYRVP